jgi:hypothetical protein
MHRLTRYIIVTQRVRWVARYQLSICVRILMSIAGCIVVAEVDAEEEKWSICSTPPAQYRLQVPNSLIHSAPPTATGCVFQTPDGEFTVEAVTQPDTPGQSESVDRRMQKEIDLMAGTVTYKKKGDTWFALSGVTPDGTEYYRKQYTNGEQWVTLRMTYPHAKNKKYDKWVTRIEKTFVPFATREEGR